MYDSFLTWNWTETMEYTYLVKRTNRLKENPLSTKKNSYRDQPVFRQNTVIQYTKEYTVCSHGSISFSAHFLSFSGYLRFNWNMWCIVYRLLGLAIFQIGITECVAGLFTYFVIYASYGFLPVYVIGIRDNWENKGINALADSYGQEWVSVFNWTMCWWVPRYYVKFVWGGVKSTLGTTGKCWS